MGQEAYREAGDGALGQVTGVIYWYLIVTLLQALTVSPGLIVLMFVDPSPANAPLAALCLLPLGPALSAAVFALRDRERVDDLTPTRSFWRGYRMNAVDVLRLWVPATFVLAIIALGLANPESSGTPAGYGVVLAVIGLLVLLWSLHAIVIASLFSFRTRDTARLAAHYLGRLPLVTLRVASLLVLAGAVVFLTFEVVLLMVGGLWTGLLLNNARRLVQDVEDRFVAAP